MERTVAYIFGYHKLSSAIAKNSVSPHALHAEVILLHFVLNRTLTEPLPSIACSS